MGMTEQEAAAFWPVYDAYQKELEALNGRIKKTVEGYATLYNQGAIPDESAKKLLDEVFAIEESELELKSRRLNCAPRRGRRLPARKARRLCDRDDDPETTTRKPLRSRPVTRRRGLPFQSRIVVLALAGGLPAIFTAFVLLRDAPIADSVLSPDRRRADRRLGRIRDRGASRDRRADALDREPARGAARR